MPRALRFLLLGVLAACDSKSAPPTADLTADQTAALDQARVLVAVGAKAEPHQALELLTTAFGPAPRHAEAAFLMARAAFRDEQRPRCTQALDAYFALPAADHPDWSAEAWVLRGWLLEREGRFAEAPPLYAKALEIQPRYGYAMFRTGNALAEAGDEAAALPWVERALVERPALLEGHFLRAQLLRRLGRGEEAERATEIHRLVNQAGDNGASTREALQEKFAALEQLETRLPQWVEGRLQLARMRTKVGQGALALQQLTALLRERPVGRDGWQLWIELARVQIGNASARTEFDQLLGAAPDLPTELRSELRALAARGLRQ
ncbi:MAG: tetratricopeptide repeat protein [Myxococcales bacterium]|nr:tetratricopeptide repeat protein [Myxococcales bacterium]